jgi:ketosteroid isomerase-like protein
MDSLDVEFEKKEIERLVQAWVKADNEKDVEKQIVFLTDDVIAHMPGIPAVKGVEANRKLAEEYKTNTGFWSFKTETVEVSSCGDLAYQIGSYHFTVKDWSADSYYDKSRRGEEIVDDGKMIIIWRNKGDGWKIAVYSSMSNLPQNK